MKNTLIAIALSALFAVSYAQASFFQGNAPGAQELTINPLNTGSVTGNINDWVGWSGATPEQWKVTYLGSDAAWNDTFKFSMGGTVFSNHASKPGDTSIETGEFGFWFTSPLGTVNEWNHAGEWCKDDVTFFSSVSGDGNTLTLWLDDGGARQDRDFNDMGMRVSAVPIPAAGWLFGSAVLGMVGIARRRNHTS